MKASVYIATSLDGFISRPNGSVDWLPGGESETGEDYGYHAFMSSVDALVMGRNTYEMVLSFGEWPYGDKPVIVLSSRNLELPDNLIKTVSQMGGRPKEIVAQLTAQGYQHVYIDGGLTIQGFIREGLIQEIIVTQIPILIGEGLPLFGSIPEDIPLELLESLPFENGFVQNKYQIQENKHLA
ncbi:MAG: dihydrofolate reductase [Chloroflexi bacterium]|jgi:dihydrofolate reductase|nr:dihydrofolate reductase [Chloroflexota bacterium]MBT3670167.1 dihydrofolate reductase [Chloroflexota bacterium]MBT4004036.1 dihydrofolate reductase [Chloroflexota bacterium]MBT4306159.1 dihydrofolate reductase [Chloroflexota bacterium]MBT4534539.1 dihydrofolate reductase [Chloroflexota bacterium]